MDFVSNLPVLASSLLLFKKIKITQHLAANEQHVILPWLKTFPKKAMDRAPHYLWPLGSIAIIYVCSATAEYYDQAESYSHRF
jgi:hypothetical protein